MEKRTDMQQSYMHPEVLCRKAFELAIQDAAQLHQIEHVTCDQPDDLTLGSGSEDDITPKNAQDVAALATTLMCDHDTRTPLRIPSVRCFDKRKSNAIWVG